MSAQTGDTVTFHEKFITFLRWSSPVGITNDNIMIEWETITTIRVQDAAKDGVGNVDGRVNAVTPHVDLNTLISATGGKSLDGKSKWKPR